MKNKKLMLIATAAMGFVALGAAGVGTLAWYTANSAATMNNVGDTDTVTTVAATQQVGNYYMKASFATASHELVQSDASGNVWVIVGGYLQPGSLGTGVKYASNVITFGLYSDSGCTTPCTEPQLIEIGTKYSGFTVTVQATGRVRVTSTAVTADPDNFATAFSGKLAASYTFSPTISTAGVLAANTSTAYISVFGQEGADATLSAGSGAGALTQYTTGGTVTTSCAATARGA